MSEEHKSTVSSPKKTNIVSSLLNIFLLFEIIRQQTVEAAATTTKSQAITSLADLALADFAVTSSGIIIDNPKIPDVGEVSVTQVDYRSVGKISAQNRDEAFSLCDGALQEILNEHTWPPRGQLLKDLEDGSLHIVLTTPDLAYGSASMGSYSVTGQTVYVVYKPGLSKEDYKKTLLNELMSHCVVRAHERCGIKASENQIALPFLRGDSIDSTLRKKFEHSITEGIERINKIKTLWVRRKEKLSPEENHLLVQFLAAAKHYTPQTFHTPLSELGGAAGLRLAIKAGIYRQEGGYIVPGSKFPAGIPFSRGHIQGDFIIEYHTSNMHSARGRIQGFLGDFDRMEIAMNAPEGPYAGRGKDVKLNEMATFIAQFPKPLLELFFPDFHTYTNWYLLRCGSGSSKTPPPKATPSFTVAGAPWFFPPPPLTRNKHQYPEKIPDKPRATRERPKITRQGPR